MSELKSSYRLVIVGGGPAGISLGAELVALGFSQNDFVILEKGEKSIQAIRQFYPEKKMTLANYKKLPTDTKGVLKAFADLDKTQTIEYFDKIISDFKLPYVLNQNVSKVSSEKGSFLVHVNQQLIGSESVAIAVGILGRPNKPANKIPVKLRKKIFFDLTSEPINNCKVLVVGGGDTSAEYCQILAEQENCDVTFVYRRPQLTKMMDENRLMMERLESEGKLHLQLECEIAEIQESADEKPQVIFSNCQNATFDKIVFAIGGSTPVNFLKTIGVDFDENGWPMIGESGETNIPNLYLLGDLVAGRQGGSIVTAYNASYRTAKKIFKSSTSES